MSTPPHAILPSLMPPTWADAAQVLCEPLIGEAPHWDDDIALPYVAYGIDRGEAFEMFEADPSRLPEMRAAARATLTGLEYDLTLLQYDELAVLDIHGSYYASEAVLDPGRMRHFEDRLGCDLLAVGIPCRGHAYVTAGRQDEHDLRRFLDLIARQHESARAPLFGYPVLVQRGELVGLLRLTDDEQDEGESLLLTPE